VILAVPADTPVMRPVVGLIVTIAVSNVVHVPPAVVFAAVTVDPTHTPGLLKVMLPGNGLTVIVLVVLQTTTV
jgi:hypothetical protein